MKKLLLLFAFLVTISGLYAQNRNERPQRERMTVEERAKRTTEWMKEALSLSEEQIPPVDSINLLYTKAQHVLMQSAEGDREKIRESLNALEVQKVEALKAVLTPEQLTTYEKKSEEMRNAFRNREGRGSRRSQGQSQDRTP